MHDRILSNGRIISVDLNVLWSGYSIDIFVRHATTAEEVRSILADQLLFYQHPDKLTLNDRLRVAWKELSYSTAPAQVGHILQEILESLAAPARQL